MLPAIGACSESEGTGLSCLRKRKHNPEQIVYRIKLGGRKVVIDEPPRSIPTLGRGRPTKQRLTACENWTVGLPICGGFRSLRSRIPASRIQSRGVGPRLTSALGRPCIRA